MFSKQILVNLWDAIPLIKKGSFIFLLILVIRSLCYGLLHGEHVLIRFIRPASIVNLMTFKTCSIRH